MIDYNCSTNINKATYKSWGGIARCTPQKLVNGNDLYNYLNLNNNNLANFCEHLTTKEDFDNKKDKASILAIGSLRAYGDEAYNDNGVVINSLSLNKFINFDRKEGYLTAESGVTLCQILHLIVPCGWFLAVTPGTKYVTLAGAIANDVHGKNHHKEGSFGCFVEEFELIRSTGEILLCSKTQNSELFYATIGGMGLTGWITWAKIKLKPILNNTIITKAYKFANLEEYFSLNNVLAEKSTYTVAWVDCIASGSKMGRGMYFTGEHAGFNDTLLHVKTKKLNIPFELPISLINKFSLKALNFLYYKRPVKSSPHLIHYDKFFYPLDMISNWNRIYGRKGFYQYQCVIPPNNAYPALKELLQQINKKGMGSFLSVLKTFGDISSGGLMSFPRAGVTLALDFANTGRQTLELFQILDEIVVSAKGAIYPAKDARMSEKTFYASFPNTPEFIKHIDPKFSSNFWRRVSKSNIKSE